MKACKRFLYLPALVLCLMYSCGNAGSSTSATDAAATKPGETKLLTAISPIFGARYKQGDEVTITYTLTQDVTADSVVLDMKGKRIGLIGEEGYKMRIKANDPVGRRQYRLTVFSGGDKQSRSGEFTVLAATAPVIYGHKVKKEYPHDAGAYTQGLLWSRGFLYESTGLEGKSSLRKTELSGKVTQKVDLPGKYFGEGLALLGGKFYQLTWMNNKALIYDAETFQLVEEFNYPGEGWGLATDGRQLYMTDGTEKIYTLDPATFKRTGTIEVYADRDKVQYLNELEWIDGELWANVYMTDIIVRIDPGTGAVKGVIDMSGLLQPRDRMADTDVLNGIAYDLATKRIFVTGKNWPKLFEIEVYKK